MPDNTAIDLYHHHNCHSNQRWIKGMTEPFPCDCGLVALINSEKQALLERLKDQCEQVQVDGVYVTGWVLPVTVLEAELKTLRGGK